MGADHNQGQADTFRRQDWQLVQSKQNMKTWSNRRDTNFIVQQYDIFLEDEGKLNVQQRMYYFRKNSKYLVASLYHQSQDQGNFCSMNYRQEKDHTGFCSNNYRQILFIQSIPIRLSDIQHIPYPDNLHLYNQCLIGFRQLVDEVGFFSIQQDYIGVNHNSVVKVWLNDHYQRSFVQAIRVHQQNMVRSLIDIIDRNIDQTQVPSVRNYLYRNSPSLKFNQAIAQFNQYVRQFNRGEIPSKLDCIDRVGGIHAIVNRQQTTNNRGQLQIQKNYVDNSSKPLQNSKAVSSIYNAANIQRLPQRIFRPYQIPNNNNTAIQQRLATTITEAKIDSEIHKNPLITRQNLPIFLNSRLPEVSKPQTRQAQSFTQRSKVRNSPISFNIGNNVRQNSHISTISSQNQAVRITRNQTPPFSIQTIKTQDSKSQPRAAIFQQRPQSYHPQPSPSFQQSKQNQHPLVQNVQRNLIDNILIRGAPMGSTTSTTASFKYSPINQINFNTPSVQKNTIVPHLGSSSKQQAERTVNNMINNINNEQPPTIIQQTIYSANNNNFRSSLSANLNQSNSPYRQKQTAIRQLKIDLSSFTSNLHKQHASPQRNGHTPSFITNSQSKSKEAQQPRQITQSDKLFTFHKPQLASIDEKAKLSLDDGKSSDQLIKKLKATSSLSVGTKSSPKYSSQFKNALDNLYQKNFSPQKNQNQSAQPSRSIQTKSVLPSQQYNSTTQYQPNQQIGRSAVSKVIDSQPQFTYTSRLSPDPASDQANSNIKYSTLLSDSPQPYNYKYSSLNYQTNYDPQLLQDMNKLKSDS